MAKTDDRISSLIESQVPFFIRNDHPNFVLFLEAYYEYLEQSGKPIAVLKEAMSYQDVDETLGQFMKILQKEYLQLIPTSVVADKALMIKHIKDLYRAKGSEKATKFLLNVLFNGKEADFYYPKRDILKASDGKWYVKKTLKIKDFIVYKQVAGQYVANNSARIQFNIKNHGLSNANSVFIRFTTGEIRDRQVDDYAIQVANANTLFITYDSAITGNGNAYIQTALTGPTIDPETLKLFVNKVVRGDDSGATAVVEALETYYEKGFLVNELEITNQKRNFLFSETVSTTIVYDNENRIIRANIYSGIVSSVKLLKGGKEYERGMIIPVESNTGSGAIVRVDDVTDGGINAVITDATQIGATGAGFRAEDGIIVTGGGGAGANAFVSAVSLNESYHPNSYNLVISLISQEQNTAIGNATYSNLYTSGVTDPANTWIANSMQYWTYSNCGPFQTAVVTIPGVRYRSAPRADVRANSRIRALGILGRMEIINGGSGYAANDKIYFDNIPGSAGAGAKANVVTVNATGAITQVKWEQIPGYQIGGSGYTQAYLPKANIRTTGGTGANVLVTAVLGDGESLVGTTTTIGEIKRLTLVAGGAGYETVPVINLKAFGSGTACARANIITGVYAYEGRYINDDGLLSSYNFLQDRDYYQQFSYVIRLDQSLNKYRSAVLNLLHPAGLKLFGEFLYEDAGDSTYKYSQIDSVANTNVASFSRFTANYRSTAATAGSNVAINITEHDLVKNNAVYLEFTDGGLDNVSDYFRVTGTGNSNVFYVVYTVANNITSTGNVYFYKQD